MTIKIPQPSMALNAEGIDRESAPVIGEVRGYHRLFEMWQTWLVGEDILLDHIIGHVAAMADRAPDGYLRVLVINAHGYGGSIQIGKYWIAGLTPAFAKWKGRVANIWITACKIVDKKPPVFYRARQSPEWNDGKLFCAGLAKLTGAYVVGSLDFQPRSPIPIPWGHVLDWNGRVFRFEPDHGGIDWTHVYTGGLFNVPDIALVPVPPIALPPHFRPIKGAFWREPQEKFRPSPLRWVPIH
jgi:hypothetical protein